MTDQSVQGEISTRGSTNWAVSIILVPCLLVAGLAALVIGTTIAGKDVPVVSLCLAAGILIGGGWLVKRGLIDRARLPRTPLDGFLLALFVGIFIAFAFSPVPRIGFDRLAWFMYGIVVYFVLVDLASSPENRPGIRMAVMIATTPILLSALIELYARYLFWWEDIGTNTIMPPYQFRFTSIVLHPNYFMIIMNLVAPLAVVTFFQARRRSARIFAAFWLMMYVFALPFSSSRGGWIGAAAWMGVLALLWLIQSGLWIRLFRFFRRWLVISIPLALAGLVAAGFVALKFYGMFAGGHPSHGSGANLNRELMWGGAFQVWQDSPWIGSGLGRLGLEYLRVTQTFPTFWWPPHAHSTPFQFLGETGLAGFLPYLALCIAALVLFVRAYLAAPSAERMWAAASLAAFAGAFAHGFFDDFTFLPIFLNLMAVNAALLLTSSGPARRYQRMPFAALALPAAAAAFLGIFYLWGYAPLYRITGQGSVSDWQAAAEAAAESARRDPAMPFYSSQAGLAYARLWQQTGDPAHLQQARDYFTRSLEGESYSSVFWADRAVLDWYAGDRDQAVASIQRAIELSPAEPDFHINYAWMLEELGQDSQALAQYRQALALNPRLGSHPYWAATPLRQQAAGEVGSGAVEQPVYHWETSRQSIAEGNLDLARLELAVSGLYDEPLVARAAILVSIAMAKESSLTGSGSFDNFLTEVETEFWGIGSGPYNHYFWRRGFMNAVVPGFINVSEDAGQFEVLRALYDMQVASGECEKADLTWQVLQRELDAGERLVEGYAPAPACP